MKGFKEKGRRKVDVRERRLAGMNWIHLAYDRHKWRGRGHSCVNDNKLTVSIKFWKTLE
jgi:hypothetical protein